MSFTRILGILTAIFLASQIYWYVQAHALVKRLAKTRKTRILLTAALLTVYLALFLLNFGVWAAREPHAADLV